MNKPAFCIVPVVFITSAGLTPNILPRRIASQRYPYRATFCFSSSMRLVRSMRLRSMTTCESD